MDILFQEFVTEMVGGSGKRAHGSILCKVIYSVHQPAPEKSNYLSVKKTASSAISDVARFWEHSVGCGTASRMLARTYRPAIAGEAFVAGLLHDVGKVILKQYFDNELASIITLQKDKGMSLEEAEEAIIGTSHAQIGSWLAEKWNLPKIICETILHHHDPWESLVENEFVACVQIGDYLCHMAKTGQSGRVEAPILDAKLWEVFSSAGIVLDETFLPGLQTEFLLEFDKSETFLSMVNEERSEGTGEAV